MAVGCRSVGGEAAAGGLSHALVRKPSDAQLSIAVWRGDAPPSWTPSASAPLPGQRAGVPTWPRRTVVHLVGAAERKASRRFPPAVHGRNGDPRFVWMRRFDYL